MPPIRFNSMATGTTTSQASHAGTAPPPPPVPTTSAMDIPLSPSHSRRSNAPYLTSSRSRYQRGSHSSDDHPNSFYTGYSPSTSPTATSSTLGTSLPTSTSPYSSRQARAWAIAEEKHARARASAFVPRRRSTADSLAHLSTSQLENTLHQRRSVLRRVACGTLPSNAQRHMVASVEQLERCLEERGIEDLTIRLAAQPGPSQSLPTYDPSTWNDTIDSFSLLSISPSSYRRSEDDSPCGDPECNGGAVGTHHRPITMKSMPETDFAEVQAQMIRSEREEHELRTTNQEEDPSSSDDDEADWVFEQVLVQLEGD